MARSLIFKKVEMVMKYLLTQSGKKVTQIITF